jgi:hypothetical protein
MRPMRSVSASIAREMASRAFKGPPRCWDDGAAHGPQARALDYTGGQRA